MRIAIVTTFADKVLTSRRELLLAMLSKGHSIIVLGAEPEEECSELAMLNIDYKRISFVRSNINPFSEVRFIQNTKKVIQGLNIDILLVYGVRLSASLAIASKLGGVRRVYAIINGAGTLFYLGGLKGWIARTLSYPLLFTGLHLCSHVFFQNRDNQELFLKLSLVKKRNTSIVYGSGVSLEKFIFKPIPKGYQILFIGRMLRDKGVYEFIEAAKKVKSIYSEAKFLLIGQYDHNLTALSEAKIKLETETGIVEHIEWTDEINKYLGESYAFVLPSYHEGTPRTVLEAMATGRPIITTDAPGCRETVNDGVNGFLIPVRDSQALAEKIIWMIENRNEAERMGKESYLMCKEKFDVNKVNEVILKTMSI